MTEEEARKRRVVDTISYYTYVDGNKVDSYSHVTTVIEYDCGNNELNGTRYEYVYFEKGVRRSHHWQTGCHITGAGGVEYWRGVLEESQPFRIAPDPVVFEVEAEMKVEIDED